MQHLRRKVPLLIEGDTRRVFVLWTNFILVSYPEDQVLENYRLVHSYKYIFINLFQDTVCIVHFFTDSKKNLYQKFPFLASALQDMRTIGKQKDKTLFIMLPIFIIHDIDTTLSSVRQRKKILRQCLGWHGESFQKWILTQNF